MQRTQSTIQKRANPLPTSVLALLVMGCAAFGKPITVADVLAAEQTWGDGIVAIGKAYSSGGDYRSIAKEHVDTLYAYDEGTVLFKPTRAAENQFRLTKDEALSYFVGGIIDEDHGFALQPWSAVRFENAGIITNEESATSMGNYYFTNANTGEEAKAEYTFAYVRNEAGELVITVHHSSFPHNPTH